MDKADGPGGDVGRLNARDEAESWQQKRARDDAEAEAFWEPAKTIAEGRGEEGEGALGSGNGVVVGGGVEEKQAERSSDVPVAVAVAVTLDDADIPDLEDDDGLVGSIQDDDGETVLFQSAATNDYENDDGSGEGPPARTNDAAAQDGLPEGGVKGEDGDGEYKSGIEQVFV